MKKSVKVIQALAVIAIALTITYHAVNRIPAPELTAEMRVKAIFDDGGCLDCHSATPNLPFYASLPVAGDIVKKDVSEALKHTDLTEAYRALSDGRPVGEVTLSKIEKSVADGSMPMAKYYLVHWGSSLTDAKKEILLDWVKKHRAEHYPNNLSATVFANEPIQPIADSIPVDIRTTRFRARRAITCKPAASTTKRTRKVWASNSAASTPRPCSMPSTTSCSSGTAGRRILPNRPAARR